MAASTGPTIDIISEDHKDKKGDRVHGMLVGVMLGDALGHAHEFRYQTDVYTGKLQYKPKHQSRWQDTKYAVVDRIMFKHNSIIYKNNECTRKIMSRSVDLHSGVQKWQITIK